MRTIQLHLKSSLCTLLAFTVLLGFAPLVIAEQAVNTDLQGEITVWSWGNYEKDGAADFNKFYPNINVTFVMVPGSDYLKKLQIAVASGGELPDVVQLEKTPRGKEFTLDAWERLDAPHII